MLTHSGNHHLYVALQKTKQVDANQVSVMLKNRNGDI